MCFQNNFWPNKQVQHTMNSKVQICYEQFQCFPNQKPSDFRHDEVDNSIISYVMREKYVLGHREKCEQSSNLVSACLALDNKKEKKKRHTYSRIKYINITYVCFKYTWIHKKQSGWVIFK